jgi:hypothetical protein
MNRKRIESDFLPTVYLCQVGGSFSSYSKWVNDQGANVDLEFEDERGACWRNGAYVLIYVQEKCKAVICHEIFHAVNNTQEHTSCFDEEFGGMCTEFLASKLL